MKFKSLILAITTASGLIPSLPVQAQSYDYKGYDHNNQMCLPTEGLVCKDEKVFRNGSKPSRSKQKPVIKDAPRCSTTPPFYFDGSGMTQQDYWKQEMKNYRNQPILAEVDGEGIITTQEKYDNLKVKRGIEGIQHLTNFGGSLGYFAARPFTNDLEQQLNAARLGEGAFNILGKFPNRASVQHPRSSSSRNGRHSTCLKPPKN